MPTERPPPPGPRSREPSSAPPSQRHGTTGHGLHGRRLLLSEATRSALGGIDEDDHGLSDRVRLRTVRFTDDIAGRHRGRADLADNQKEGTGSGAPRARRPALRRLAPSTLELRMRVAGPRPGGDRNPTART